jgi:hypothetical protein
MTTILEARQSLAELLDNQPWFVGIGHTETQINVYIKYDKPISNLPPSYLGFIIHPVYLGKDFGVSNVNSGVDGTT